METRFLLTQESPVPEATKAIYLQTPPEEIITSTKLDGLPQRMILNPLLRRLEKASSLQMLLLAMKNGLAFTKLTGVSLFGMMKSAMAMQKNTDLTLGQTMMAANAPMMIQEAMVKGHPNDGILPSGQVAGVITELPTVAELIERIIREADQTFDAINALRSPN